MVEVVRQQQTLIKQSLGLRGRRVNPDGNRGTTCRRKGLEAQVGYKQLGSGREPCRMMIHWLTELDVVLLMLEGITFCQQLQLSLRSHSGVDAAC